MRRIPFFKSFLVVVAFLPLAGMDGTCAGIAIPQPPTCSTSNVPAVRVTVVDESGAVLPGATIGFSYEGGEFFIGACNNECEDFTIAFDLPGRFDIIVVAPGYLQEQRVVNVGAEENGCTPITEDIIFVLKEDLTVAVLAGAWRAQTVFGTIDLRFGNNGEAIGAILYDRTISGDGNFYVSYNGSPIQGVAGQQIAIQAVSDPTRVGDVFNFDGKALGVSVGFIDALMSGDFNVLSGAQPEGQAQGLFATYTRLADIPAPLQSP